MNHRVNGIYKTLCYAINYYYDNISYVQCKLWYKHYYSNIYFIRSWYQSFYIVLGQTVLQHLLTDFEDKLLILIQSVDEIKTLVFSLNICTMFWKEMIFYAICFQNYWKLLQHDVNVEIQQLLQNCILADLNLNVITIIHKNHEA